MSARQNTSAEINPCCTSESNELHKLSYKPLNAQIIDMPIYQNNRNRILFETHSDTAKTLRNTQINLRTKFSARAIKQTPERIYLLMPRGAWALQGCYAAQVGSWLPKFRDSLSTIFKSEAAQEHP
jgi:hypothetical protein